MSASKIPSPCVDHEHCVTSTLGYRERCSRRANRVRPRYPRRRPQLVVQPPRDPRDIRASIEVALLRDFTAARSNELVRFLGIPSAPSPLAATTMTL